MFNTDVCRIFYEAAITLRHAHSRPKKKGIATRGMKGKKSKDYT